VVMWNIGSEQDPNGWQWIANTYQTQLRQGNWDWYTQSQTWYKNPIGASGHPGDGTPQTIPNSLYLTSKPAFFGLNSWPWVDPSTGLVSTLPAKARFAQIRSGVSATATHDFIADGKSDIGWRDNIGNIAAWLRHLVHRWHRRLLRIGERWGSIFRR
jgi:hypothetical protein